MKRRKKKRNDLENSAKNSARKCAKKKIHLFVSAQMKYCDNIVCFAKSRENEDYCLKCASSNHESNRDLKVVGRPLTLQEMKNWIDKEHLILLNNEKHLFILCDNLDNLELLDSNILLIPYRLWTTDNCPLVLNCVALRISIESRWS
jgi:hypothetical protein